MHPLRVVWCEVCGVGHRLLSPEYDDREAVEAREKCLQTHKTQEFTAIPNTFVSDEKITAPVKSTRFNARDEAGNIIRMVRWRRSVMEPYQYKIIRFIKQV